MLKLSLAFKDFCCNSLIFNSGSSQNGLLYHRISSALKTMLPRRLYYRFMRLWINRNTNIFNWLSFIFSTSPIVTPIYFTTWSFFQCYLTRIWFNHDSVSHLSCRFHSIYSLGIEDASVTYSSGIYWSRRFRIKNSWFIQWGIGTVHRSASHCCYLLPHCNSRRMFDSI